MSYPIYLPQPPRDDEAYPRKRWYEEIWKRLGIAGALLGSFKFGESLSGYTEIEADGTMVANGDATCWDDVAVDLSNIKAPTLDPPTWTAYKGGEVPAYSATATNVLYFRCQLPHTWREGDDINFHIHVAYPNANAGNSVWAFTHSWASRNEAFPTQSTITKTFAAPAVTDQHTIHDFGLLGVTGKKISSVLICSLSRIGGAVADTYGSAIYGVSADFHVVKNTLGSHSEYVK